MARERLYLFDTTLRDGAQTQGVDFSVEDKRVIAGLLDELGLDYVEGGWPGANPTDTAFFSSPPEFSRARLVAFGMTKRSGRSLSNDPGLEALLDSGAPAVCMVAKSWDFHVDVALGIPREENLEAIAESVAAVCARGLEAMVDAEHFFDGYKANPEYALSCLRAAHDNGARWCVLCDTNGGTMPHEVADIVAQAARHVPGAQLGIHAHNDTGNAVANTLAAVRAGVRQVQGTVNGLGERCGNANLISLLPTLLLKPPFADTLESGVGEQLGQLRRVSCVLDELLNRAPDRHAPYVGAAAFAHKGGLHVSAVRKDPRTYEHVPPETAGNQRRILVSDQSGQANIRARLEDAGICLSAADPRARLLLHQVKEREFMGYAYDGAEASFELLARRVLGLLPAYFNVESYKVVVQSRAGAPDRVAAGGHETLAAMGTVSEAEVRVCVDGQVLVSTGRGNGPVHALDRALRRDLGKYASYVDDLELVDYKVRILSAGTEGVTRVMVESRDSEGARWFTVGVSPNIVDASMQALTDSIVYALFRKDAPSAA